ncbi:MAG: hypothetical protein HYW86_03060 [Candidatus Roizmanbacteria bacterium]|nr:MAG: hypothetical protein HYW86_03060 [Candidatus Roizmanbacteria bacterium]
METKKAKGDTNPIIYICGLSKGWGLMPAPEFDAASKLEKGILLPMKCLSLDLTPEDQTVISRYAALASQALLGYVEEARSRNPSVLVDNLLIDRENLVKEDQDLADLQREEILEDIYDLRSGLRNCEHRVAIDEYRSTKDLSPFYNEVARDKELERFCNMLGENIKVTEYDDCSHPIMIPTGIDGVAIKVEFFRKEKGRTKVNYGITYGQSAIDILKDMPRLLPILK